MINPFDLQLGVLLRQTQWLLDDAAHDIPAGRYNRSKRDELAVILEHVASIVRATKNMTAEQPATPARAAAIRGWPEGSSWQ